MMIGTTQALMAATTHNGHRIGEIRKMLGDTVKVDGIAYTLDGAMGVFTDRETGERFRVTVETIRKESRHDD